jgi:hypothetical protein
MKFWCYFVLQLSSMCLSKAGYCAVLGQQSRFMLALKEWNFDLDSKFYITWPQSSLISFLLTGLYRCKSVSRRRGDLYGVNKMTSCKTWSCFDMILLVLFVILYLIIFKINGLSLISLQFSLSLSAHLWASVYCLSLKACPWDASLPKSLLDLAVFSMFV